MLVAADSFIETMKVLRRCSKRLLHLLIAAGVPCLTPAAPAQAPVQGTVSARGLIGSVTYFVAGGAALPLLSGAAIPIGSMIKTSPGAAVDLLFSHNAGVVRVLQNSTLSLNKFSVLGDAVDLQLDLLQGSMAGFENKLSSASQYQIKVSHGIAELAGCKYRMDAQGYLVLLEGSATFAFVPPSGDPVPFELKAPSPQYFSPVEGVRPAPIDLVREVVLQTKGQLRGR